MVQITTLQIEKLEILSGSRAGASKGKAAVRIDDLLPLLALPVMKSSTVSSTPTAAQFNALCADMAEVHTRLFLIAEILRKAKQQ